MTTCFSEKDLRLDGISRNKNPTNKNSSRRKAINLPPNQFHPLHPHWIPELEHSNQPPYKLHLSRMKYNTDITNRLVRPSSKQGQEDMNDLRL